MAWHSKRHNIKHRKAAQDAKRSKILAQVSKLIQMAAKNGADPDLNPNLSTALVKARQAGLSKDAIQKAIDKGAGNIAWEELVEIFYEWYGTHGIALYIKCITSNTNRSGSRVKAILTKYGGSMWAPGSVAWQFQQKGEIYIDGKLKIENIKWKNIEAIEALNEEEFELAVMETVAEDYEIEGWIARIVTARDDYISTVQKLEQEWRHIDESDLVFLAENTIHVDDDAMSKLEKLIDVLEDDEDVDTVRHNAA